MLDKLTDTVPLNTVPLDNVPLNTVPLDGAVIDIYKELDNCLKDQMTFGTANKLYARLNNELYLRVTRELHSKIYRALLGLNNV